MKRIWLSIIVVVLITNVSTATESASSISISQQNEYIAQQSLGWEHVEWTSDADFYHNELEIVSNVDNTVLRMKGEKYITRVSGFLGIDINIDEKADENKPVLAPSATQNNTLKKNFWEGKAKEVVLSFGTSVYKELTIVFADEASIAADTLVFLSYNELKMEKGEVVRINAQYTNEGIPMSDVAWSVDNSNIISVDAQGNITALNAGTAIVKATTTDGRGLSSECAVTVSKGKFSLNVNLSEGWNWISTNLSGNEFAQTESFIKDIQTSVYRIVGFDSELIKDSKLGFVGQLNELSPTECYQIHTTSDIEHSWTGYTFDPAQTEVPLKKGWNWIGYIPTTEFELCAAFTNFTPEEGDVIKDYSDFSTYENGKWTGTLTVMRPGRGYMYFSGKETAFHYSSDEVAATQKSKKNINEEKDIFNSIPWELARHKYPNNMNIIARVSNNNDEASAMTIGAFVGNECRGIGKYVEGHCFITVYGEVNPEERITFRAYDTVRKREYMIMEDCEFSSNLTGTLKAPFILTLDEAMGISNTSGRNEFQIALNSGEDLLKISGECDRIQNVAIVSVSGMEKSSAKSYPPYGINVSHLPKGIYIVVIKTHDSTICKKLIKHVR